MEKERGERDILVRKGLGVTIYGVERESGVRGGD